MKVLHNTYFNLAFINSNLWPTFELVCTLDKWLHIYSGDDFPGQIGLPAFLCACSDKLPCKGISNKEPEYLKNPMILHIG